MPGRRHGRDIVEYVALRLFERSEIRHNLRRLHYDFAENLRCRAHDFRCHPHDADYGVHLREVTAVRAERLPNVRNRIEADDIRALIAEEEKIFRHIVEDGRICVV